MPKTFRQMLTVAVAAPLALAASAAAADEFEVEETFEDWIVLHVVTVG